jgi:hypothetical protein
LKSVFISYNQADRAWAEWIAWTLEEAGYRTVIQAWDFRPGCNFVLAMQEAAAETERTIAVLSPSYLGSLFTQPEWATAFSSDPTGQGRKLIPVRVQDCQVEGLLKSITWIDLADMLEEQAARALLAGMCDGRVKPAQPPVFPGHVNGTVASVRADRVVPERPIFPLDAMDVPVRPPKPPHTGRVLDGRDIGGQREPWLVTLDEMLQIPEVRDAVIACRVDCDAMCQQIDDLITFKELHDQLHQLQFNCYDPIVRTTRAGIVDELSLADLGEYELTLSDIVATLREIDGRLVSGDGGTEWIQRLADAHEDLRSAIELSDAARLQKAVKAIRRVLERQPSRINDWILQSARELRLENLVRALGQVCRRLTDQVVERERADELNNRLAELSRLTADLSVARMSHQQWQRFDVELRLINVSIDNAPDELVESWPDVKRSIEPLCAGSEDDWAVQFRAAGDRLDRAIVAEDKNATELFRRFRRHAGLRFYKVDTNMKRLCEQLHRTGLPLATTLRVI